MHDEYLGSIVFRSLGGKCRVSGRTEQNAVVVQSVARARMNLLSYKKMEGQSVWMHRSGECNLSEPRDPIFLQSLYGW